MPDGQLNRLGGLVRDVLPFQSNQLHLEKRQGLFEQGASLLVRQLRVVGLFKLSEEALDILVLVLDPLLGLLNFVKANEREL